MLHDRLDLNQTLGTRDLNILLVDGLFQMNNRKNGSRLELIPHIIRHITGSVYSNKKSKLRLKNV